MLYIYFFHLFFDYIKNKTHFHLIISFISWDGCKQSEGYKRFEFMLLLLYHSCTTHLTNALHKYRSYRPLEPLRLKEMMKFNQTSKELRLIDDLVVVWPLQFQVKSDRLSKHSLGEATGKVKRRHRCSNSHTWWSTEVL